MSIFKLAHLCINAITKNLKFDYCITGSDSEEKDEYEDSDEVPDGPFVMVTETYIPEEDYDL